VLFVVVVAADDESKILAQLCWPYSMWLLLLLLLGEDAQTIRAPPHTNTNKNGNCKF